MLLFHKKTAPPLWEGKTSLYAFIRAQGENVDGSLPDDGEYWAGSRIRWVAGGLDGAMSRQARPGRAANGLEEWVQLLVKLTGKRGQAARKTLYAKLIATDLGDVIDELLGQVREHPRIRPQVLYREALWLAETGAHRQAVKFGLALLGLFRNEQVKELLMMLGRHDEFTLYAAVAMLNGMDAGNEALWELAQHVHGWGKIHLVERLEPTRPEMAAWLLRHGCRNTIMPEYSAYACASKGDLRQALAAERIDAELLEGATDILGALMAGGPAENIDDYAHAPQALADFVRLAGAMPASGVKQLLLLLEIGEFCAGDAESWALRLRAVWTERQRCELEAACRAVIADKRWEPKVLEAVRSGDADEFLYGAMCAGKLGIDIWELLFGQLEADPLQERHYMLLGQSADPVRLRRLIAFAEERLPLERIANGPAQESGLGREHAAHRCLDNLLLVAERLEGLGTRLVVAGLNSPVVSNRNKALQVLESWDVTMWGLQLAAALARLAENEPNAAVKQRIHRLKDSKAKGYDKTTRYGKEGT
ncbi:limonene hydroxylase [Paenibacillus athensensis]|uniref:Limonene hydroxylase n=1 Tax=Paenibacillus athensensis TaxID=1967502 RepID=A0A4Y8Q532_9BACL|nr:limonene hydroxylase [Paenibacillus athensensis]MCD1261421.1 limonene hydroxylase [Paenibacillus athensensis]